jgi:hydrogenase expression/formation protein HypE
VTGDTKVVARGQCDQLYLNTAGLGDRLPGFALHAAALRPGDAVLVSGTLGDHGMAVLAARTGIAMLNGPRSDSAPVHRLVAAATPFASQVRFMRDPTRGGVAAVLNELVEDQATGVLLQENALPLAPATRAAAAMLGLDLLEVACEGRVILVCDAAAALPILQAWHQLPEGQMATQIGTITSRAGQVILSTPMGGQRLVDVPEGELLPRIC